MLAALMLVGTACADETVSTPAPPADAIRVAAFNFAESELLAELYAQALEAAGFPVERLGPLGSREIVEPALELGFVDVVPEYAGTMLSFVSLGTSEPTNDPAAGLAALRDQLASRGMVALDGARAQNRNAFVVTKAFAVEQGIRSLSGLGRLTQPLTFGGPRECPERNFCLLGLEEVYGIEFTEVIPMRGPAVVAAGLRAEEIDVGLLFSTDPELVSPDLVILDDDLGLQPAENVVPVVRADALERWGPGVATALDAVSSRLDTSNLAQLNAGAAAAEQDVPSLVAEWLASA